VKALCVYVGLKTVRSRFAAAILLTPVVMSVAPLLGLIAEAHLRHRAIYPFALKGLSSATTLSGLAYIVAVLAALAGGGAAFWIFRSEIADRSVGSLVLATKPLSICVVAMIYGIVAGLSSYAIAMPVCSALTGALAPAAGPALALTVLLTVASSSLGVILATLSPDPAMLLPLVFATIFLALLFADPRDTAAIAAVSFVLPVAAARLLERRCAL
jgi:hypothetical protein